MDEFDHEARRQRKKQRLGTNAAVCIGCGFIGDPWQFESHHLAGKAFDKRMTFPFELRCHREFTHQQLNLPKPSSKSPPASERLAHLAIGIAIAAKPMADTIELWGRQLVAHARRQKLPQDSLFFRIGYGLEWLARFFRKIAEPLKGCGLEVLNERPSEGDNTMGAAK